jgi:hypothetical protein
MAAFPTSGGSAGRRVCPAHRDAGPALAGLACALAAAFSALPATAYSDRAGTDIVMDAPWRTVRDYIPVMFFFPQFEGGRRVERISIFECADGTPLGPAVLVDAAGGPDTLNGATFVGPLGEARGGLDANESVTSFWHYIVRVPHAALSRHGVPDVHELRAEVEWTRPGPFRRRSLRNHRVLRVSVDPGQFPSLAPEDRYFDTHVHTIAEQTTSGVLDVNGASKAFAGPIIMLLEASYALGLVQTQPGSGNWAAYRDSIVVTDHNMFYSREPYDAGVPPRCGPTSMTDGHAGEAAWYRSNLGRMAGTEITLRRGSNQDGSAAPNLGHHLLAYDTRLFEGPWHGGLFLTSQLENPNTLEAVLTGMKAANTTGFAYAAHPNLEGFVWPPEYFAQAIGFPPYDTNAGPFVDSSRSEFLFKGSEVWNTKMDQVARNSGRLPASSAFDAMNPFPGGPAAQRFRSRSWDGELMRSLDTLFGQLGRGLAFSFREAPGERFIRKLYMIAGSDAHGDFNYSDEVTATAVPYSGVLHGNAYARVRTYALAHDQLAGAHNALDALRDGNTVLTDGPVFEYQLDADARHNPAAGAGRWHDAAPAGENGDGRIGGSGAFDGGHTMLVPLPGEDVWIRSLWKRSATPGAGDLARYRFDRVMASARDSFTVVAGLEGAPDWRPLPRAMDSLAALVATARDPDRDERCIANPVWVAPVRIAIATPASGDRARPDVAFPAGTLKVTFHFPLSMSADTGTRACLRPLDSRGNSTDPELELVPDPGWQEENGMATARYSATNLEDVPDPPDAWDAGSHASVAGTRSFVVYLKSPADVHRNLLNDVGRAFSITRPSPSPEVPPQTGRSR